MSNLIIKPRGEGKTTEAVNLALKENGVLIVHDKHNAKALMSLYGDKGLRNPITYQEYVDDYIYNDRGLYPPDRNDYYIIDNFDMFCYYVLEKVLQFKQKVNCATSSSHNLDLEKVFKTIGRNF